jgi:hypothetical protein
MPLAPVIVLGNASIIRKKRSARAGLARALGPDQENQNFSHDLSSAPLDSAKFRFTLYIYRIAFFVGATVVSFC